MLAGWHGNQDSLGSAIIPLSHQLGISSVPNWVVVHQTNAAADAVLGVQLQPWPTGSPLTIQR